MLTVFFFCRGNYMTSQLIKISLHIAGFPLLQRCLWFGYIPGSNNTRNVWSTVNFRELNLCMFCLLLMSNFYHIKVKIKYLWVVAPAFKSHKIFLAVEIPPCVLGYDLVALYRKWQGGAYYATAAAAAYFTNYWLFIFSLASTFTDMIYVTSFTSLFS